MKPRGDAIEVLVSGSTDGSIETLALRNRKLRGKIWRRPYQIHMRGKVFNFIRFNYQWFILTSNVCTLPTEHMNKFVMCPGRYNGECVT